MATAEDHGALEDDLTCAVCLELYHDPYVLPCGHSFCLLCLRRLQSRSERGLLRCPECRQSHPSSVRWQKNFKLASIADGYRSRGRALDPARKTGEVRCDYCTPEAAATTGGPGAVKTCLKCEVSMCPEHVRPHLELAAFRDHPLVEPLGNMKKRKCAEHDEMFRYYCLDDRTFLCNACTIEGGHKEHSIKTLKNAMKDLRASLDVQLEKANRKIRRVEKSVRDQKEVEHQNKAFLEEADQEVAALREVLTGRLEGFLVSLQECTRALEAKQGTSVQQVKARVDADRSRLHNVHTGILQLMQENDPFRFIKEYSSSAKRYHRLLRRPLFVPHDVVMDRDSLALSMEGKLEEFITDLRQRVSKLIDTVCAGEEEDEENESNGDEDNGDEEDEEMRSGEEEDQDDVEFTDEEEEEEEEEEEQEEEEEEQEEDEEEEDEEVDDEEEEEEEEEEEDE